MTTIQSILPMSRDAIEALSKRNKEPEWLSNLRIEAMELAGLLELPKLEKTRIDRWNLDSYGEYKEAAAIQSVTELPEHIQGLLQEGTQAENLIIQQNSNVIYSNVAEELSKQGVIFMGLETAVKEHPDLVQKYLMTAVKKDENRLTALHAALWSGGVFLYVPKNVRVEVPLQAIFFSDDDKATFAPHILIVAEDNSAVTYVDNYLSGEDSENLVHNGVVEVFANRGASVQFASVHSLSQEVTDLNYRRAILQNDAKMNWVVGEMNYGNCMSDTTSILEGGGSFSDAKVICVGTGDQKLNITTKATHIGRSTSSDMITRAVMRDSSTAIINGITKIEKGATNANGEQTEKILMLSPEARGDANPMLLIDEDEVTAGHAASVGQVDKNQIYYLMSRGISRDHAMRLIIYGFLAPVVTRIPIKHVEDQFRSLVERKLGQ
jgi:Fe-S cluster assembly protein SufD